MPGLNEVLAERDALVAQVQNLQRDSQMRMSVVGGASSGAASGSAAGSSSPDGLPVEAEGRDSVSPELLQRLRQVQSTTSQLTGSGGTEGLNTSAVKLPSPDEP